MPIYKICYEIRVNPSEFDRVKSVFTSNNMRGLADLLVSDSMVEPGCLVYVTPENLRLGVQYDYVL